MKTKTTSLLAAFVFTVSASVGYADIPDQGSSGFGGIYKIVSSNDPIFPMAQGIEYFMDFGTGIQGQKLSGSVAVSMRQNPNVKVKILSWQYFPKQDRIVIGNPYFAGSRNAVAKGVWKMTGTRKGVLFERGSYQVVIQRADPADY